MYSVPVAQVDRASVSETESASGSSPLRHEPKMKQECMIKINRTLFDHIKENDFKKIMFLDPEKIHKLSGNIFLRLINHFVPPTKKRFRETFNATENKKILAQISLIPDNFSSYRWQISSLKIREANNHIAKPLIDFVVNKYGGNGISTFLVYINEQNPEIISLFKNECGFRSCAKIDFYSTENLDNNLNTFDENNFKDLEEKDILELLEINTFNIFPHFRPSLISNIEDFKHEFFKRAKNDYFKVFLVNNRPEGYFRIYSNDKKNFFADIITSKAYEHCYGEIIAYIQFYLKQLNNFESFTILLKRYRETAQTLEESLKSGGFSINGGTQILVKDYWQKIGDQQNEEKLFVFFNDLTTQGARFS